ncbi:hypothetical protein [Desulfuromonas sp. AOP6]|uniref:hypothetical protein n=1 Tax=Desulfuromonas sp. AOP6 TaxID=1566351 RepID=UPI0012DDA26F|nr:hypothetical protein [Desulfuromonas sp. AOP6]
METEIKYLKAWIIFSILAVVVAVVGGAVVGGVVGFILGIAKVNTQTISVFGGVLGALVGLYSSFHFYKWSVKKYILPQSSFTIAGQ